MAMIKAFGAILRIRAKDLINAWKKNGAFVRHVPILFKYGPKLQYTLAEHERNSTAFGGVKTRTRRY